MTKDCRACIHVREEMVRGRKVQTCGLYELRNSATRYEETESQRYDSTAATDNCGSEGRNFVSRMTLN